MESRQTRECRVAAALIALAFALALAGCSRFHPKVSHEYVYVLQKQAYLRDHVAAVSNRTGSVSNGQRLRVIERGRRFLHVQDDKGVSGWIEERFTTPEATRGEFVKLGADHAADPAVATAVIRDEVFMHSKPGRDTDRFFLLEDGDKIKLLARASMPKPLPPQATPTAPPPSAKPARESSEKKKHTGPAPVEGAPDIPMEDWWLVRDAQNRTGWILGRRFDVDVPDAIAGYSEGQRFVGAYVIKTVDDPDSNMPNGQVPIWLTLLVPYKDGLPYDYNQVRVFGWNSKKHRYETDYRETKLWGYLPVKLSVEQWPNVKQPEPSFTLLTDPDKTTTLDPDTGIARPAKPNERPYRMEGALVYRVVPVVPKPPPQPKAAPAARAAEPRRAVRKGAAKSQSGAGKRRRR